MRLARLQARVLVESIGAFLDDAKFVARPMRSTDTASSLLSNPTTGVVTAADATALDYPALVARCMGNLGLVQRVLAKFRHAFQADLAELEHVAGEGNREDLARVAHRMKGTLANVAAKRLELVAAGIEEAARSDRYAEVPPRLDELRSEWLRFLECSAASPPGYDRL
jgi:HPt (histidine-containing phosphotransfer) domain-containing protein